MWHQVVVIEKSYPEYCGVGAHAQEEDSDKAHHLVQGKKIEQKKLQLLSGFFTMLLHQTHLPRCKCSCAVFQRLEQTQHTVRGQGGC